MVSTLHWELREYMSELRFGRLEVLLCLILHSNMRGRSWPSTSTILKECGYSDRNAISEAKDWLHQRHAFLYVPHDKRVGQEIDLHQRRQVYQTTGFILMNGKLRPYLFTTPESQEEIRQALAELLDLKDMKDISMENILMKNIPHKVVPVVKGSKEKTVVTSKEIKTNPFYDAIAMYCKLEGALNTNLQKMLEGRATDAQHKPYNLEVPMTVDEFIVWANEYQRRNPNITFVQSPAKIQSSILSWRKEKKTSSYAPSAAANTIFEETSDTERESVLAMLQASRKDLSND